MLILGDYVACIAEGAAEKAIIDILLDNDLLIFDRKKMIDESVLRCRDAKVFEKLYLRKEYDGKITVIRILDSRHENFNLSKAYKNKIDVINIVTAPEIEMLIIINEGRYEDYCKTREKPCDYCKSKLKLKKVKSYSFIKSYFSDPKVLVFAIKQYARVKKKPKREYSLLDLLK